MQFETLLASFLEELEDLHSDKTGEEELGNFWDTLFASMAPHHVAYVVTDMLAAKEQREQAASMPRHNQPGPYHLSDLTSACVEAVAFHRANSIYAPERLCPLVLPEALGNFYLENKDSYPCIICPDCLFRYPAGVGDCPACRYQRENPDKAAA